MSRALKLRKDQSGLTRVDKLFITLIIGILGVIVLTMLLGDDSSDDGPSGKTTFIRSAKQDYCDKQADQEACLRSEFRQPELERYCSKEIISPDMQEACINNGHAWSLVFVRLGAVERNGRQACSRSKIDPRKNTLQWQRRWYKDVKAYGREFRKRIRVGLEKPTILPRASGPFAFCPPPRTGGLAAPLPSG